MSLDLFDELSQLVAELDAAGLEYALAGALALAVYGVPRATADIDLLVRAESVESALAVGRSRGFSIEAAPMCFADGLELRRATKIAGEEAITLDLLLVDAASEPVWRGRQSLETERGRLWVVSRQGLIQMKVRAGREQDLADLRRLAELDS
jgi:hypothetical protein